MIIAIVVASPSLVLGIEVNNDNNKKVSQEGNVKIAPSTINTIDPVEGGKVEIKNVEENTFIDIKKHTQIDSTDNSISKYNYIFYFIYKYKYENKMEIEDFDQISLEE